MFLPLKQFAAYKKDYIRFYENTIKNGNSDSANLQSVPILMINCNLRNWFYNHTNLTGLEKVNGEHSLIMLVYNIKRSINILGASDLIAKIRKWNSPYKAKACLGCITNYFRLFKDFIKKERQFAA
jgi:hypothetical protein